MMTPAKKNLGGLSKMGFKGIFASGGLEFL